MKNTSKLVTAMIFRKRLAVIFLFHKSRMGGSLNQMTIRFQQVLQFLIKSDSFLGRQGPATQDRFAGERETGSRILTVDARHDRKEWPYCRMMVSTAAFYAGGPLTEMDLDGDVMEALQVFEQGFVMPRRFRVMGDDGDDRSHFVGTITLGSGLQFGIKFGRISSLYLKYAIWGVIQLKHKSFHPIAPI